MKIPHQDHKRLDFYREIVDVCLASRARRMEQYAQWRNYFFFGTSGSESPSPWNLLYAHLDTVSAFLYASDSTRFSVRMGSKAQKSDRRRTSAFAKRIMEEWGGSNADLIYEMGVLWALIYDTTIIKHIRRGGTVLPFMIDPACFGVYREDVPMLDRQEAFVHVYYMTKTDLEKRIALHPNKADILKAAVDSFAKKDIPSGTPPLIDRVVLTSGMPGVGSSPNITGEANVTLSSIPDYTAQLDVPVIEMQELYVWNDAEDDYQVCTLASESVVVFDRPNIFLPRSRDFEGEHGFVQICPNPLPDYFWGQSECSKLAPVQDKLNARMEDIENLEGKQVDPPGAWGGMGIAEDKMAGFNIRGTQLAIDDPNFKHVTFEPNIPEHIYQSIDRFQAHMDVISGLPNVVQGKGEAGVRSAGHAGKLLTVGSARPKKRALIIEKSLELGATLFGKCLYVDEDEELYDEDDKPFIPAQMSSHFFVDVDAHSNSPVFMENNRDLAAMLLQSRSITRERFIQMLKPPMEEELLRDMKEKIVPGEQAAARAQMEAEAAKNAGAGKTPLKSVG